ncbi:UDP-N-acetylglucosamine 2-epimerase [Pirellula sp. SH-Sr6A]|uniref:non-hydrolyzing UDP-N-acetylglucosamine 2-epimerase n=1 Tax=Pirellula sp. SH-Sr6A TaxID=1632865 RepID=UPI00078C76E6|nr:UDP-N-acetylglucosamine 2-epimerase (non-hydrolyzing) [Pirellula sp. SH-Sr6A]AMV31828.1 UDP-N-acetylglucosamine 2-epimerase [Pirellula sp. SH-Sr6A]
MKICLVVGTRPEAIKMAPIYRELRGQPAVEPILLSTGQHREMLLQTLAAFGLQPDHDLGLMVPNQTLPELTARAITALSSYFSESKLDRVLVQGDTTSVLAGALAAFYHKIPIGHVEAGLRTGDIYSPYPEEMNRRLTTPLCRYNFAPTEWSKQNLVREGIDPATIHVTGNTVIDALHWMNDILSSRQGVASELCTRLNISDAFRDRYLVDGGAPFLLVTAHRRESHGAGMAELCNALQQLIVDYPELGILFPVHLNPAVRQTVLPALGGVDRIELIDPVGYEDFVWLMARSHFIISDSGGIQEEAPSFGKPVLVTRETTERPEGVHAGTCTLVGTDMNKILSEAHQLLSDPAQYQQRSQLQNPYGDGTAAQKITRIISGE